jgi:hypothetical protein
LNAKTAIEIVVYGGVIPAVAALAAFFVIGWSWPTEAARRYQAGAAFALAVFVGFVALPTTTTLVPSQFWESIPYVALAAVLVAGLTCAQGVLRGERWLTIYLFAIGAAWVLVPNWPDLVPAWPVQMALVAIAIVALDALLTPLPARLPGRAFPFWLMLAAATSSLLVMAEVSETIGRLAVLAGGALAGSGVAAAVRKDNAETWSLALPYAVTVGGFAYAGAVYPMEPMWLLVSLPAAPLALWICALGPLSRLTGLRAIVVQAVCVLVPLVIVVGVVLSQSGGAADEW